MPLLLDRERFVAQADEIGQFGFERRAAPQK